ncbi:MAG: hypothetical protein ACOYXU_01910 [Nitrospirota bacterium]
MDTRHRLFSARKPSRDGEGRSSAKSLSVREIAEACEAWLARQGVGDDGEDGDPDDAHGLLLAASAGGWTAVNQRPVRTVQVVGGKELPLPPRCATCDGYNLHAGVAVKASDRGGLVPSHRFLPLHAPEIPPVLPSSHRRLPVAAHG